MSLFWDVLVPRAQTRSTVSVSVCADCRNQEKIFFPKASLVCSGKVAFLSCSSANKTELQKEGTIEFMIPNQTSCYLPDTDPA